jgi:hypothetical protein
MRKSILLNVFVTLLASVVSSLSFAQNTTPNVVLILMDNFAYGELGSYGGGVMRGRPRHDLTHWQPKG